MVVTSADQTVEKSGRNTSIADLYVFSLLPTIPLNISFWFYFKGNSKQQEASDTKTSYQK